MRRKLHILIHSLGMPFDAETLKTKSLGGSETAAYYQAVGLARLGHKVELWTAAPDDSVAEGVTFTSVGAVTPEFPLGQRFEQFAQMTPHDVLIIQRHPLAFHRKWAASVCVWQLHDLALHRSTGMIYQGLWQTNAITAVSEWHKQQIISTWGIKADALHVIPNGVDPALYAKPGKDTDALAGIRLLKKQGKFVCLFQSRPERGKMNLVMPGGIMDKLRDTNAHLVFCAYQNTRPEVAMLYQQMDFAASQLPNCTDLGSLTKQELADVQQACDLMVYPSDFEEVSCISAMEAMAAGLPLIASRVGALPETCEGSGTKLIDLDAKGQVDIDAFVNAVKNRCASPESMHLSVEKQLQAGKRKTWDIAVGKLELLLNQLLDETKDAKRYVRHGFEHSDIQIAEISHFESDAIRQAAAVAEFEKYDFRLSNEAYKAHYDKHGGLYYDSHEDQVIGEDVSGTTRYRGVLSLLAAKQDAMGGKNCPPLRIMDYGCAHGHYLLPFAKMLPASDFYGVDINERAIGAAFKWCLKEGTRNVTLRIGTLEDAADLAKPYAIEIPMQANGNPEPQTEIRDGRFDVIMANEVLEHLADPMVAISVFRSMLKPGGWLIATTPVGRWEWSGTVEFRKAREHLWHFSRADLESMLENYEHEIMYAPAGQDIAGGAIGSYCWRFEEDKSKDQIVLPPISKRLDKVVPRQTVSACLIVKDGDKTLRSAIESIVDWVDEIVVGVDPKTTDRTREVLTQLAGDFPLKPFIIFEGQHALDAATGGFSGARNQTLDAANGDWILWMDADEICQNPSQIWKFLKPSAIDAIGMGQVHYSADPERVLTKDYPNRLFRRSSGARFQGLVHEHPETEQGKSIPNAIIRHEAKFLHSGYVDENTRRARYSRNMPLLRQDILDNPQRTLNKFLTIRDLTQGVMFELERTGGNATQEHIETMRSVVDQFEAMIDKKEHVRMLVDALEYYSTCLRALNEGFEYKGSFGYSKPPFNDLNVNTAVEGRFRNRAVLDKLINRISEEATKHYESKHL